MDALPNLRLLLVIYISLISFPLKLGNTYYVMFCPYQKRINHSVTLKIYNNHTHNQLLALECKGYVKKYVGF